MEKVFLFMLIITSTVNLISGFSWSSTSKASTTRIHRLYSSKDDQILRQIDNWACMKNCGACCKLGPIESRPDLPEYLSPEDLSLYNSMVGSDSWCIHFDKDKRMCTVYDTRPSFCRVDLTSYVKTYDIKSEEFTDFCSFCCTESIADVYGEDSDEMKRFESVLESIEN